ncbi:MAG: DUF1549 and DUF1553 domain-containing protein [Verrucomicrobiota bacterium]
MSTGAFQCLDWKARAAAFFALPLALIIALPTSVAGENISFRNDIMALLSKAGCSAGTCHGNKNGKGGFKLSLRGEDPDFDHLSLTRDQLGRRLNSFQPEQSLILLKPTTALSHEGGLRFEKGSRAYEMLLRWIAAGAPNDLNTAPRLVRLQVQPKAKVLMEPEAEVTLRVTAFYSDGTSRDVTELTVFELSNQVATATPGGIVRRVSFGETTVLARYLHCQEAVRLTFVENRPDFHWANVRASNFIDEHIFAKLRTLRMNPSELCSDAEFIRRVYLDLLGILPTAEEARQFVEDFESASERPGGNGSASRKRSRSERDIFQRRARLVESLFDRPEFADFWALKWADLLRVEGHSLDQKGVQSFHHWIRQSVAENKPWDLFVQELVTARGSTYRNPAANYYRPHRDPARRAKAAAQIFLGTRLQCAECHNHPSDRWTQDDYYDWASLFAPVNYKVLENHREIATDEHEWKGEQIVFLQSKASLKNPRTGRDAQPRFLAPQRENASGRGLDHDRAAQSIDSSDSFEALARWLTSPDNPWFARVQVNRIWFHLLGRGLVDPPDDFRATNPASHPELLEALARDFVQHRFDTRHVIRTIVHSRTYQLSSKPNSTNGADDRNFSHALVRRLGAEQLLDCQSQVTGVPLRFAAYPAGMRAAQLPGVRPESKGKRRANALDLFLETFGKPPRLLTTDTERSCECNLGQAFQMISGPALNEWFEAKENRLTRLIAAGKTNQEILDEMFWTALTRPPSPSELAELLPDLEKATDRRARLEDVLWALLNSKDFLFRK